MYLCMNGRCKVVDTTMDRLLLRSAVGYQVTPTMSIWQGYCWTPSFEPSLKGEKPPADKVIHENRIYQQLLFENRYKQLKIMNRTRLEERWIENTEGTSVRARHLLRLTYPVFQAAHKPDKWFLVGSNELFFNLNTTSKNAQAGFEQNRFYMGINRKLTPHASVEIGYINIQANVFDSSVNRSNHGLSTSVSFKF